MYGDEAAPRSRPPRRRARRVRRRWPIDQPWLDGQQDGDRLRHNRRMVAEDLVRRCPLLIETFRPRLRRVSILSADLNHITLRAYPMQYRRFSWCAPTGVLIIFGGVALLFGLDPWFLASIFMLSLPSALYVVLSHGLLRMTAQGHRGFWHRRSVTLYIALSIAGFWMVLLTEYLQQWLGGAS